MINNCRENAFVNKRLQRKDSCSLHLYVDNIKTYYFRMFLCYLIVANQYIHLLFPDLFLRANCLYLSNNNFFLPSYQKH